MESYFYFNMLISCGVIAMIKYGKGTSDANYYLSLLGIAVWFVPYSLLGGLIPPEVLNEPMLISMSQTEVTRFTAVKSSVSVDWNYWLELVMSILLIIGLLLFIVRFIQHSQWRRKMLASPSLTYLNDISQKYQHPVYSVEQQTSAFLLGITNPVIVISNKIKQSKYIDLVICHEKQHIKNHDNLRLLLLALCECLFWWNPLVRYLVAANRFFIEARCDKNASKIYGEADYTKDFTALILQQHLEKPSHLVCPVMSHGANNIERVKLLKENRKMTIGKKLTYLFLAMATVGTVSWHTVATASNSAKAIDNKGDPQRLGALIDLDIGVVYPRMTELNGETVNRLTSKVQIWSDFDDKFSYRLNDDYAFNIKVTDIDELALVDMEIVELSGADKDIVANPKLKVAYDNEGMVEISSAEVSDTAYSVTFTVSKTSKP